MKFRRRPGLRRLAGLGTCVAFAAAAVLFLAPSALTNPVTGAVNTTDDPNWSGPPASGILLGSPTQACLNGGPHSTPAVNCNLYQSKTDVFLSGTPNPAALGAGTYFFAVLSPGGQPDPNDGAPLKPNGNDPNLSDESDFATNREFSSDGTGNITPLGGSTHAYDSVNNVLQVAPYADTPNPGGVYILATCKISNDQAFVASVPTVDPRDCKYDAFKVKESETTPASGLTPTKTAIGSFDRTFPWTIEKSASETRVEQSGSDATFHYTVTVTKGSSSDGNYQVNGTITVFNPNVDGNNDPVPVDHVTVTDAVDNGGDCAVTGGSDVTISGSLADFAYTCTYASDPSSLSGTNTATVAWESQTLATGLALAGGSEPFSVGFSLDPNVVNDCITVTDSLAGALGQACDTTTFHYDLTFHNQPAGTCTSHDNTAVIDQTSQSDGETVTVCRGANLTVTKGATPAFTRTYLWRILKAVDKTRVELLNGSATFNYTVTVTQTGFTDSGWGVTGAITVNNPNDFESVTVSITDAVNNGGSCSVTNGASQPVAASSSITRNYSCTWSSAPSSSSGTNTATITWDSSAAHTSAASATGTAGFSFTTPTNPVNKTIHVTDSYAGPLGSATATDATPFTTASFTYPRTIPAPATGCISYPNTATITETSQTSSQSVTVCRIPARTGALTMGFWKNKNGQNIIKGDGSTNGVCKLTTWLWQYAPFQDLAANASCTAVATYVNNIISAATCGGSSCNAMLKAQMLATALDVYFSDPAFGGNKIGAPNGPIGNFTIDLTVICQMIDGSNSSTCSGTYYNVSIAFGGATCLSVSQMLTVAAGYSNAGGSIWYAQYKPTQVKAKDAFDSINNVVAFQC